MTKIRIIFTSILFIFISFSVESDTYAQTLYNFDNYSFQDKPPLAKNKSSTAKSSKEEKIYIQKDYLYKTDHLWRFDVTPYIWGLGLNGKVDVGKTAANINQSFSQLLEKLDFAAMLYVTAHKDAVGAYFNGIYTVLSNDASFGPLEIHAKNRFGIFGGGLSYIIYQKQYQNEKQFEIEPYLGARYTLNNTQLKVDGFTAKKDEGWTDPIIGLRLNYDFSAHWMGILMGDVGGTNAQDHYSYSGTALLGYKPKTIFCNTTAYLGYRFLDQHYRTGSNTDLYDWDMRLFGPILGINFAF